MEVLKPGLDIDEFFELVRSAPARALLLDYDGTLAPFRTERDKAVPYPGVREALDAIMEAGGTRLVIISGRYTKDVIHLVGLNRLPEIWGTHGWERLMPDGSYRLEKVGPLQMEGLRQAALWAEKAGLSGRVEHKPASLAVHWRGLGPDEVETIRRRCQSDMAVFAQAAGLEVHDFDGGIELRVAGRDKGDAVRTLIEESGKGAALAYLGDDQTDEDAFSAIEGHGLGGLVRERKRETAAGLWLQPPGELLWFINRWREAEGGR